jgi:hypothetical protein
MTLTDFAFEFGLEFGFGGGVANSVGALVEAVPGL